MTLLWEVQQAVAEARFDRIIDVLGKKAWPSAIEGIATATAYMRVGAEVRVVEHHPALSGRVPIRLPDYESHLRLLSGLDRRPDAMPATGQLFPVGDPVTLPIRRQQFWTMNRLDPHDLRHEEQLVRELSMAGHGAMSELLHGVRDSGHLPVDDAKVLPWVVTVW